MKKPLLILLVLFVIVSGSLSLHSPAFAVESSDPTIVAYYFHGVVRCPTCHKLEQYSKEAIENDFKDAIASGKLEFKIVNVEEKGNEHFVSDYKLYTKSLVLSLVRDGKETKWKNLVKIWEYVGNKEKYIQYVINETEDFLKEAT